VTSAIGDWKGISVGDMMGEMDAMMGAGHAWMTWMVVVFLVAVAVATVSVLAAGTAAQRRRAVATKPSGPDDEALRILRQRYARSEIDEDEFLHRQSALAPY